MAITPALSSDIPVLVRLVNSAYRGSDGRRGWTHEIDLIGGDRTHPLDMAELMEDKASVILKYVSSDDQLVGCVYLQPQGDRLYLGMLSVDPDMQAGGIGKALLAAAVDYAVAHGCGRISITVLHLRHELITWYERHGYERTGEVEPFHAGERFGTQKVPLELVVL